MRIVYVQAMTRILIIVFETTFAIKREHAKKDIALDLGNDTISWQNISFIMLMKQNINLNAQNKLIIMLKFEIFSVTGIEHVTVMEVVKV